MLVHKLLDAARGRDLKQRFLVMGPDSIENGAKIIKAIEAAECFDFGDLPLQRERQWKEGSTDRLASTADNELYSAGERLWVLPDLTTDEKQFWIDGLIPLPSGICWYEFRLGSSWSGLLVMDDAADDPTDPLWSVVRIDIDKEGNFEWDGVLLGVHRKRQAAISDRWQTVVNGNRGAIEAFKKTYGPASVMHHFVTSIPLSIYMTLMLNSKSTDIEVVPAPVRLNRKRMAHGKTPLPAHRIVTIVPGRYIDRTDQGGTHRTPRLHWRRSHKRHFDHSTPGAKWMETEQYRGKAGWWVTVIPRCLVSKAEVGTVTHEYHVITPTGRIDPPGPETQKLPT